MPVAVREKFDRIWRNFLWEGLDDKKKLHLMKWENVIKPIVAGGLGLGILEIKNWAVLLEWWWSLGKREKACGGGLLLLNMARMSGVGFS